MKRQYICLALFAILYGCEEPPERNAPPIGSGGGSTPQTYVEDDYGSSSGEGSSSGGMDPCQDFLHCIVMCDRLEFGTPEETETLVQECIDECEASPLPSASEETWVEACISGDVDTCEQGYDSCLHFEEE